MTDSLTQESHVMSDEEWDAYIDGLIKAHEEGRCGSNCAQCQEPGDPLERWLS